MFNMLFTLISAVDYLVQYHPEANVQADIVIGDFKASLKSISPDQKLRMLKDSRVKRIEQNGKVKASGVQKGATWGIDRIDSRTGIDQTYNYVDSAGSGVTAYVVDTGIYTAHPEFEGRATFGFDSTGEGKFDGNGHGTHVSGTIGGKTYGVAKNVQLIAVRVLDTEGSGTYEGVIQGIEWVVKDAVANNRTKTSVANMSLGGGYSKIINDAVKAAVDAGVIFVVAAGNESDDACNSSPSSEPSAITVGATNVNDEVSYFSNYGKCVDINAPGEDITSSWNDGKTETISGTSMATPHVVGVVALYLGEKVENVASVLQKAATKGKLTKLGSGTQNLLLFNSPEVPACEKKWYCFVPQLPGCDC
eukprot:NODE_12_length_54577_cov_0.384100.p14 type:complete len:363 gc:universal NODE_12_length_54577_cov_0.384100:11378-12466(+)